MLPIPHRDLHIRSATEADIPFMDRLQKLHGKAVGYFPTGQFRGYIDLNAVLIAETSRTPVGYVIHRDRYLKRDELGVVYQLNVEPGGQRGYVGAALLKAAFERAAYGCRLYCCWCAQDLAANKFWEAMGFVPLAFRAGSDKKKRVHIFWQKRIVEGDATTPYWYPFQTNGGAMRADRLAFPIPPGTHWTEVEAIAVPVVDADGNVVKALPAAKKVRAKKKPVAEPEKIRIFVGGKFKWIKRPTNNSPFRFAPPPPVVATPVVEAAKEKPTAKIDPRFLAANRELRDRWLEHVNATPNALPPVGKYDATRLLPVATPEQRRLLAA